MNIFVALLMSCLWASVSSQSDEDNGLAQATPFPTPEGLFQYSQWGETSFGSRYQDLYYWGFQNAVRRPGWSWGEPLAGYAPFCYGETCYSVQSACKTLGGELLHESYCSFPEDVKIAGPSCWDGNCVANGRSTCGAVGGITIGDSNVEWCLFKGDRTIFGPACYDGVCYTEELTTTCSDLGGRVWNDNYCILDDYYTVVGPVCWKSGCPASARNQCLEVGGTPFKYWCLVKGCDYTVIGPTCSELASPNVNEQCFEEETVDACNQVGGQLFADRFCLIDGTDWTLIGPTMYFEAERTGETQRFCRELQDDINPPFTFLESYDIAGRFCLVKKRLPPVGPFCQGDTCYVSNSTEFCENRGGEIVSPFHCALPPDQYRRVEGPLMWNGRMLESDSPFCEGLFCAINETSPGRNLRCPASSLNGGSGGDSPGTDKDGNDGANNGGSSASMWAVSTSMVAAAVAVMTLSSLAL